MNGAELREFLLHPVARDHFANRIVHKLTGMNVHFIGQLLFLSPSECLRISLGQTSIDEIRKVLEPRNLIFGKMYAPNSDIHKSLRAEELSKKEIKRNLERWLDDPATNVALHGRLEPSVDVFGTQGSWVRHFLPSTLQNTFRDSVLAEMANDQGLRRTFLEAALKDPNGPQTVINILMGASLPGALIPSLTPQTKEVITAAIVKAVQTKLKL